MSAGKTKPGDETRPPGVRAVPQPSADGAALVVEDLSVGYHQKDGGVLRVVANVDAQAVSRAGPRSRG